ncbi:MAG: response regulator [Gallionella sp.]|nr:response regulator [Gallionella sp.]
MALDTSREKATSSALPVVLVVDDMVTNRKLLGYVLKPSEFQLVEACDGSQALEILRKSEVDIVLLDVMMPGIDGFETCRLIRQELGLTLLPVIMLTSMGSPSDVAKGMGAGADGYITKPFNSVELVTKVKTEIQRKRLTDRVADAETALLSMARFIEARDENAGNHCDRLVHAAGVFGKALELGEEDLDAIRHGGVLHDIGKLGIPEAILFKKGKLDAAEWQIMKQHTLIGEVLCSPLRSMQRTADIVRCHHEKWNGTGYPDGLKGEEIPFVARVFQIIDVFDALSTERPHKPAFSIEKVIEVMEQEAADGLWDPQLMGKFVALLRERPEDLRLPDPHQRDRSQDVIEDIKRKGVMDCHAKESSHGR